MLVDPSAVVDPIILGPTVSWSPYKVVLSNAPLGVGIFLGYFVVSCLALVYFAWRLRKDSDEWE